MNFQPDPLLQRKFNIHVIYLCYLASPMLTMAIVLSGQMKVVIKVII